MGRRLGPPLERHTAGRDGAPAGNGDTALIEDEIRRAWRRISRPPYRRDRRMSRRDRRFDVEGAEAEHCYPVVVVVTPLLYHGQAAPQGLADPEPDRFD